MKNEKGKALFRKRQFDLLKSELLKPVDAFQDVCECMKDHNGDPCTEETIIGIIFTDDHRD